MTKRPLLFVDVYVPQYVWCVCPETESDVATRNPLVWFTEYWPDSVPVLREGGNGVAAAGRMELLRDRVDCSCERNDRDRPRKSACPRLSASPLTVIVTEPCLRLSPTTPTYDAAAPIELPAPPPLGEMRQSDVEHSTATRGHGDERGRVPARGADWIGTLVRLQEPDYTLVTTGTRCSCASCTWARCVRRIQPYSKPNKSGKATKMSGIRLTRRTRNALFG